MTAVRILHLVHYFPPETHGGTQEYVAELAQLQRAQGHLVAVVSGAREHAPRGAVRASSEEGILVWRLLRNLETEGLSGDLGCERIGREVTRLLSEFAPHVVHVHHWHALSRDLVRRAKASGARVILTLHDLFTTCPRFFRMPDHRTLCAAQVSRADCAACVARDLPGLPAEVLEARLAERGRELAAELAAADLVLAVSDAQRDLLVSLAAGEGRPPEVLPLGIAHPPPAPPPPAPLPGRLRLVHWAGLDPRKGAHVLLAAVAESERRDAFEVHFHGRQGEADYMAELESLARGLRVSFHGPFEDAERPGFAARNDLAVFPFLAFETYGLVVDEALHAGLPVLVSDRGAPPARLGGRGLAFDTARPRDLTDRLEELLETPERLAAMRRAPHRARDLAAHHAALDELYHG